MAQFRKKPVIIEAVQHFSDRGHHTNEWPLWLVEAINSGVIFARGEQTVIKTLEGEHIASEGDWIIQGVKGELYPCKPDIFAATYDAALTPRHEAPDPTCQKCGGEVQGWTCQECGASFRENGEGSLVFSCHEAPAEPWYGDRDPQEVDQAYGSYDGTSCAQCGRERVMVGGATGRRICEKCGLYQEAPADQTERWAKALYDNNAFYTPDPDDGGWSDMAPNDGGIHDLHMDMARAAKSVWDRADEAPAEGAGEDVWRIVERVANLTVAGGDPLQDPAFAKYPAIADLVTKAQAALRARSSAPEAREGEAVAWRYRSGAAEEHWKFSASKVYADPSWGIEQQPLYTHPAAPSADQ